MLCVGFVECFFMVPCDKNTPPPKKAVFFVFHCEFDGGLNLVQMSEEIILQSCPKLQRCQQIASRLSAVAQSHQGLSSTSSMTKLATTTETGEPIAVPCIYGKNLLQNLR